jgi:ribosomal-protein-alanine N-acetyltransferase
MLKMAQLATEWEAANGFWSIDSCVETMASMTRFFSAAATLDTDGPWLGWYLASCTSGTCELLYIHTSSRVRGRGVASQLVDDLKNRVQDSQDIDIIFLEVRPSNVAAIKLYESNGFLNISRRKRYYSNGDDALVYQLKFSR